METFIVAPLIVGGVVAALGLLISILDGIVNNYGEVVVNINNHTKDLTVKGGAPLLRSLSQEKIFIPSACGGKGSCGACKAVINSDVGPLLPTETPYMSEEEKAGNVRLACQVKVKKDIDIEIPEELFNVREYNAVVESTRVMTYDIVELYLKLDQPVKFKAGMYMQLVIPSYKAKKKGDMSFKGTTMRAYSISSPPSDNQSAEFLVRAMPDGRGIATSYVHHHLEPGMHIQTIGPFGDFYLQENDTTMICIGGGSGMAPFRSILRHMKESNMMDREVWYFFGCRDYPDIYYLAEMRALEKEWPNFHCIFALSDQELHEPEEWDESVFGPRSAIIKGRIDHVVARYMKEEISPDSGFEAYLCGGPMMIKGCTIVLLEQGVSQDNIYYDEF
ncbi:2Fe-2S iron-sulfur cluster binding domain-containing protein [Candidatus Haliotispira prima]|uniref:2Fe-2S iron-sulfur cluster binding domain-containing protein n=1 Tax=Candidatus Haliotispira prima TaxID=3034016 RepID=A0ABY8MI28_9SPIO|nr:2Fe-2S iron-sulfur cluster binding domain-containing protein [Candidatus Haliotispira prima]